MFIILLLVNGVTFFLFAAKNNHRLTLLYLCNDVVQNCSRKNAPIYKESFSDVLAEAVTHLRFVLVHESM